MEIGEVIAAFCRRLRVDPPERDGEGRYGFVFDGELTVHCRALGRSEILLTGVPGRVPGQAREAEALLRRLLKINLARMRNQSGVLSLEDGGDIVLHRAVSAGALTPGDFEGIMERFVNELAFWTETVKGAAGPATPSPAVLFP
jgi:hypothetical protein